MDRITPLVFGPGRGLGSRIVDSLAGQLRRAATGPLQELAENPMLLTIMALVQTYYGTLPDERAKLEMLHDEIERVSGEAALTIHHAIKRNDALKRRFNSVKAAQSIWGRFEDCVGKVTPANVVAKASDAARAELERELAERWREFGSPAGLLCDVVTTTVTARQGV